MSKKPENEYKFKYLLVGNPNCGKSTLFNRLTGLKQKTGNFQGVTVEKKTGFIKTSESVREIWDLPGIFSLDGNSEDKKIASKQILSRHKEDRIIYILDSLQLERSLQLLISIIDSGAKVQVVLTMKDLLERRNISIDTNALQKAFGVKFHLINTKSFSDLDSIREDLFKAENFQQGKHVWKWEAKEETILKKISKSLEASESLELQFAISETIKESQNDLEIRFSNLFPDESKKLIVATASKGNFSIQNQLIAKSIAIKKILSACIQESGNKKAVISKADKILLHPIYGMLAFFVIMGLVFQFLFSWAEIPMDGIDWTIAQIQTFVSDQLPQGPLAALLVDGVLGGVGAVMVFIPQIGLLFFFIGIMEESGYMARVSFVMDRIMGKFGLSGKSFIPLLSSAACAVPAIMGARTIENKSDRITTILISPLVMCSARYPVYILIIGTIFVSETIFGIFNLQGFMLFFLFLLGLFTSLVFGLLFKKTIFRSSSSYFLMELPNYKIPSLLSITQNVLSKINTFLKNAGQIILYISVILWFVSYYPIQIDQEGEIDTKITQSYAASFGKKIEPIIQPLGFDWKIGISLLTSFAAREVMVSTLAILYGVDDADEENPSLREAMRNDTREDGSKLWTPLTGFSLLVFFAYASQCMSTLAVVKRETNSYFWPFFQFTYMTLLAYLSSFFVYQVGGFLGY
ncbi:MAG: ferrous iron transport protein B [Leptospiraceae bacterium]|nr:ferrous iron transport protein B [Leptospiraceae bacterium]MCZ8347959.1 ferrous iron transport protein B [Leptospiraceae bacterium]